MREITDDEEQAFVVIDTAIPENPGHASIYAATTGLSDGQLRDLRERLLPLLEQRMRPEEAFRWNLSWSRLRFAISRFGRGFTSLTRFKRFIPVLISSWYRPRR